MKNLLLIFSAILLFSTCSKKDETPSGSFQYTVSGSASGTVSGSETNFGSSNGELFIRLTEGTDELIVRVLIDPAIAGVYNVNPILVNQQNLPIEEGDAFADLNLGSVFSGDQRDFSTNAGNGGSVSLTNVESNTVSGTFSMSLLELLSGGVNQPEINITGQFTAVTQ